MMDDTSRQIGGYPQAVRPPLAFLPVFLGESEGMSFTDRTRLAVQNAGAWLMVIFGMLFVFLHAWQGSAAYVGLNCAFVSTGATSLWLAAAGFRRTALAVISVGSGLVFFFAALWFHNGMENYLLVTMAASILLLDNPITRVALAGFNAAAYSYVKLAPQIEAAPMDHPVRHFLNILLFLLALSGLIEFFRVLNSDYLKTLENANAALDNANRSKEKLFSVIAHDLRGPVGNLKVSLDLLGSGALAQDEFSSLVADLAADVDNSYACLENLLSWSVSQLGGLTASVRNISLGSAVDEAIKVSGFAASRKGIKVETSIPADAHVSCDPQHLQAILRNLLSNAIKFTPGGGRVSVSAARHGNHWVVFVEDTGVGMAQEKARRLFEGKVGNSTPGTDAETGLGLGLEICRDFVVLNRGTIAAESAPGKGTVVRVGLPSAPAGNRADS
ncbi:MAG: HAMP domain-containing sensor histidine kinase [Terrimicrobiaceae bacterium]